MSEHHVTVRKNLKFWIFWCGFRDMQTRVKSQALLDFVYHKKKRTTATCNPPSITYIHVLSVNANDIQKIERDVMDS